MTSSNAKVHEIFIKRERLKRMRMILFARVQINESTARQIIVLKILFPLRFDAISGLQSKVRFFIDLNMIYFHVKHTNWEIIRQ